MTRILPIAAIYLAQLVLGMSHIAAAQQGDSGYAFAYGGRLVDAMGLPLDGTSDIRLRFFASPTGNDQLGGTQDFLSSKLRDGTFQVQLSLSPSEANLVLGDGSRAVYVEVEAAGRVYPRQRLLAVPFALQLPVDQTTVGYDQNAALTVSQLAISQIEGLSAELSSKADANGLPGKADASHVHALSDVTGLSGALAGRADGNAALSGDVSGSLAAATVDKIKGIAVATPTPGVDDGKLLRYSGSSFALSSVIIKDGTVTNVTAASPLSVTNGTTTPALTMERADAGKSGYLGSSDWTTFHAKQPGIGAATTIAAGTVTAKQQRGIELKPHGTAAGQTGELRFDELAANGSNHVGFKAPDALAGNRVWTLPASDGAANHVLATNGSGLLSWAAPNISGGDLRSSINLSDLTNPTTARTNLGVGPLATLDAVTTGEITDATIADSDISPAAAIATSKASGALTAIAGHDLGSLATAGSVASAQITDGTIADVDVSVAAAIATSKLTGSLSAIAGHGLGALATMSSVDSSRISDGAVANADISAAAALATSKLSGPVSAIAGHGLGGLATLNAVGSAEVTDGSIGNADVSGSAGIDDSKLATITTAGKVSGSAVTSGTIGGTTAIATSGQLATTGNIRVAGEGIAPTELLFGDSDDSKHVGLRAPASVPASITWTLPDAAGANGQVLRTDGSGTLSWASGLAPSGLAGGDLTGSYPHPTLVTTGGAAGS